MFMLLVDTNYCFLVRNRLKYDVDSLPDEM